MRYTEYYISSYGYTMRYYNWNGYDETLGLFIRKSTTIIFDRDGYIIQIHSPYSGLSNLYYEQLVERSKEYDN